MRELALRYRVRWLLIPAVALALGCALIDPLQDPDLWSDRNGRSSLLISLIFAVASAFPIGVMLTAVRTVAAWAVGVVALTIAAVWLPVSFALSESSTRGLAFLVPVIYGLPAAAVLAIMDRYLRSPSRDPVPAGPQRRS